MKVRDMIAELERDGWVQVAQAGSHRQFKHPTKRGKVTVAGGMGEDLKRGTVRSIRCQAQLPERLP